MSLKPCLSCGTLSPATRCEECGPRKHSAHNTWRWTRLSRRLRKLQPFCESCGTTEDLTVDHIVPLEHGGAPYDLDNLRVICRSENSTKGTKRLDPTTRPTPVAPRRIASKSGSTADTNSFENDSHLGGAVHGPAVTDRR